MLLGVTQAEVPGRELRVGLGTLENRPVNADIPLADFQDAGRIQTIFGWYFHIGSWEILIISHACLGLSQFFLDQGLFKGGGVTEGGGFHTPVRGTMFVCDGTVTPGPSRECDITVFVKGRPKSARQSRDSTVAARRVQSVTVPSSRV